MYGIPNMKLEKHIIDRKIDIMKQKRVTFVTNADVGKNYNAAKIKKFDRIILARCIQSKGYKSSGKRFQRNLFRSGFP